MTEYYEEKDNYIEYPKAYEEGMRLGDYSKNPYAIGSGSYYDFNRGVTINNNSSQNKKINPDE